MDPLHPTTFLPKPLLNVYPLTHFSPPFLTQGKSNIFAIEPRQLYTESATSAKEAKKGLGGSLGIIVVSSLLVVGGIASAILWAKKPSVVEFDGPKPLSQYVEEFQQQ